MNKTFNAPQNTQSKFAKPATSAPAQGGYAPRRDVQAQRPAPTPAGTMPTHLLKVKTPEGTFKTLTGLFSKEGKGGTFLQGLDRETGLSYYLMGDKKNEGQHILRVREVDGEGNSTFRDIANLSRKEKNGESFLAGGDDAASYFVWNKTDRV